MPMSPQILANIRQKYPQYNDIDDATLSAKVIAKYPEYDDPAPPPSTPAGGTLSAAPDEQGFLSSAADSSGLSGLAHAAMHPIDTAKGFPAAVGNEFKRSGQQLKTAWDTPNNQPIKAVDNAMYAIPFIGGSLKKADEQYGRGNVAGAYGTAAGLGAAAVAPEVVGGAVRGLSQPLKSGGATLMDMTIGAGKKEFKRGAAPGASYLEAGGTPAFTMKSLANKASDLKAGVGEKLGEAYDAADASGTLIPSDTVRSAIMPPIQKAIDTTMGPGGTMDPGQYIRLSESYDPMLQAGDAAGGIKPSDVFSAKKNVAQNTSWSDPLNMGLKSVRQAQVGKLGDVLSNAVPEVAPLNKQYQGLANFSSKAADKSVISPTATAIGMRRVPELLLGAAGGHAITGDPITAGILAGIPAMIDTVPGKTSLAYGAYKAGQAAQPVANFITHPAMRTTPFIIPPKKK